MLRAMKKLTIGLLQCDHVRPELRHINGDYQNMFPALFNRVDSDVVFKCYDVIEGILPASPAECDGYITTGSSFSVYDDEAWIHNLSAFVRKLYEAKVPYVGICFGHQMLGFALGGVVHKAPIGWCVGRHEFKVHDPQDWMTPYQESFSLLMMCQDQVISLPTDSRRLASTADCQNAMILTGQTMLGIQAHPEFTNEYDAALMELRVDRIGHDKVKAGIASLTEPTHETVAARWILNFFINLRERK
jgi:GMP synthase-like glutamine amidotransferase